MLQNREWLAYGENFHPNTTLRQIETWPSVMVLIPAPEQFSLNDMHEYIKSHQPCIALFRPATNDGETRSSYMALMQLLSTKRIVSSGRYLNPVSLIFAPSMQRHRGQILQDKLRETSFSFRTTNTTS